MADPAQVTGPGLSRMRYPPSDGSSRSNARSAATASAAQISSRGWPARLRRLASADSTRYTDASRAATTRCWGSSAPVSAAMASPSARSRRSSISRARPASTGLSAIIRANSGLDSPSVGSARATRSA